VVKAPPFIMVELRDEGTFLLPFVFRMRLSRRQRNGHRSARGEIHDESSFGLEYKPCRNNDDDSSLFSADVREVYMEDVGKALGTLMALAIQSLAWQEILPRKSILHNAKFLP
jgi:hypothetical protein